VEQWGGNGLRRLFRQFDRLTAASLEIEAEALRLFPTQDSILHSERAEVEPGREVEILAPRAAFLAFVLRHEAALARRQKEARCEIGRAHV
jgi:hypothetical protein